MAACAPAALDLAQWLAGTGRAALDGEGAEDWKPLLGSSLIEQELSKKDIEKILRYINYMENKYNAERNIITVQLENLASSTLQEFRKRDEMLQWLINYSNVKVEPASLQER